MQIDIANAAQRIDSLAAYITRVEEVIHEMTEGVWSSHETYECYVAWSNHVSVIDAAERIAMRRIDYAEE